MHLSDVLHILRINAYILLYALSSIVAGALGRFAAHIVEACILRRLFSRERLERYRDWLELARSLCILTCVTGFLIVAVGLLFLHLVGALPHEYDEVAFQVGVAFFGLGVFVVMCLGLAAFVAGFVKGVTWWMRVDGDVGEVDEEQGLHGKGWGVGYGTAGDVEEEFEGEDEPPELVEACHDIFPEPDRTWIKLTMLSSVRDLDMRRIGGRDG